MKTLAVGPAVTAWRLPALLVILAGVSAALTVGKLAPAIPVLQKAMAISLMEAGFLLSLVQLAGMSLGLAVGLLADSLGLRRCMLTGLALLFTAGTAGAASANAGWLLAFRALELALGAVWLQGARGGSERRRGRGVPQSLSPPLAVLASPSSGVAGQRLALLMRACVRSRASSPS